MSIELDRLKARVEELEKKLSIEYENAENAMRAEEAAQRRVAELEAALRRLDPLHDESIRADQAEARVAELISRAVSAEASLLVRTERVAELERAMHNIEVAPTWGQARSLAGRMLVREALARREHRPDSAPTDREIDALVAAKTSPGRPMARSNEAHRTQEAPTEGNVICGHERLMKQAKHVTRVWEDDPCSLETENAIRELGLRADSAVDAAQRATDDPRPDKAPTVPIPMVLHCPECKTRHVDEGEFATKAHHTHSCQGCGLTWRPSVVPTIGVQFLPGFKNAAPPLDYPMHSGAGGGDDGDVRAAWDEAIARSIKACEAIAEERLAQIGEVRNWTHYDWEAAGARLCAEAIAKLDAEDARHRPDSAPNSEKKEKT